MKEAVIRNIIFDHAYTVDQNYNFLHLLEGQGFVISERITKHPKTLCRFITFEDDGYLEFIHLNEIADPYDFPGLSFATVGKLQTLYEIFKVAQINCEFEHRNYEWESNSIEYLPGWNFILFPKLRIKQLYIWFTEKEGSEEFSAYQRNFQSHPNGVTKIIALEIHLNKTGRQFFEEIFNQEINECLTLTNGVQIFWKTSKTNRLSNIILETRNISKTKSFLKNYNKFHFRGYEALQIKNSSNNKLMWDLLIVERLNQAPL